MRNCHNIDFLCLTARIDDDDHEYEGDDWMTGQSDPLRADRWFRHELEKDVDCAGIRCNIWERAKKRSLLTHCLAGGGEHCLGYHAVAWESILHGKCGEYGGYKILCSLTSWVDTCLSTIFILMPAWIYRYCLKI